MSNLISISTKYVQNYFLHFNARARQQTQKAKRDLGPDWKNYRFSVDTNIAFAISLTKHIYQKPSYPTFSARSAYPNLKNNTWKNLLSLAKQDKTGQYA